MKWDVIGVEIGCFRGEIGCGCARTSAGTKGIVESRQLWFKNLKCENGRSKMRARGPKLFEIDP